MLHTDIIPVARLETFRALKLSRFESFGAIKGCGPGILYIKEFSDLLQLLSHPDLVDEPNEVIGKVENLWGIVRIEDKQDSNHNLKR